MPKLNVNIDHVATLRQQRLGVYPSVLDAGKAVVKAGADGITMHLREDRRHVQDHDVFDVRKHIKTKLNLEMAAYPEIIKIALKLKPEWCTLVPEKRRELTTEGGLDCVRHSVKVGKAIDTLKKAGILVSLFVDPDIPQVREAKFLGADFIELHTGTYADAKNKKAEDREFAKLHDSAAFASMIKLGINAGHGLNYTNMKRMRGIKEIEEFSIGHSIISRAVFIGLENAVREMIRLTR